MANEISFTAGLTVYKSSVMSTAMSRALYGSTFTMNGNPFVQGFASLTNNAAAIDLGSVTQPHWAYFGSNANNTATQASTSITNAINNGSGLIRITSANHGLITGDVVTIASVGGTTEANGIWPVTQISSSTFDLIGSTFTHAYGSGGTVVLSNSIRIRNGASGADLVQLFPGEAAFVPLQPSCVPYGLCNATAQLLEYLIVSY